MNPFTSPKPSKRDALKTHFNDLVDEITSGAALREVDRRQWTMNSESVEQTFVRGGSGLRFVSGTFSFDLTSEMRTIFSLGDLEGRARVIETHLAGSTVTEWEWDSGIRFPPHHHAWREILVFVKGSWSMLVDGVDHVYGEGDSCVIPPYTVHSGVCLEDTTLYSISLPALSP